jgi:hypothetical protein
MLWLALLASPARSARSEEAASVHARTSCRNAVPSVSAAELLEFTGVFKRARAETASVVERLRRDNPKVPAGVWKSFAKRVANRDALEALYVPIYARHLSRDDVCGILDFYRTPLGAHYLQAGPRIQEETRIAAQVWASDVALEILTPADDSHGGDSSPLASGEASTKQAGGRVAAIHELLRVSGTLAGAQTMMDKMVDQIRQGPQASQLPVSFWDDARKRLSDESDLLRLLTPAYADQLSDTQVRGLIGFYTSPVGSRFVAALPAIQSESLDAGAQLGRDAAKRAVHEVMGPLPQWRMLHPPASGATPTERPPEKGFPNSNLR